MHIRDGNPILLAEDSGEVLLLMRRNSNWDGFRNSLPKVEAAICVGSAVMGRDSVARMLGS